MLPAILQVHTSCGFSLCKHDIGSSPHACCRQYCKFIHPVVSACATTHREFTTCLLPAIQQAHITHNVFSLPRKCLAIQTIQMLPSSSHNYTNYSTCLLVINAHLFKVLYIAVMLYISMFNATHVQLPESRLVLLFHLCSQNLC